jgi:hypothetical protein
MYYRTDDSSRVYVRSFSNELLIYDYRLKANDTFTVHYDHKLVVDFTDSIQLENGETRKRLALRCSFDEDPENGWGYSYWIEGLGGVKGVYDYYPEDCIIDANGHYTMCIYRNDTLLFDNPDYDSCWHVGTSVYDEWEKDLKFFPNPISDAIQIPDGIQFQEIIIYNMQAQIQYRGKETSIPVVSWMPGVYVLTVHRKNQQPVVVRLTKI